MAFSGDELNQYLEEIRIRSEYFLKHLSYHLPSPAEPNKWGSRSASDYTPRTEQGWKDEHFYMLAKIGIQRNELAWELAVDFRHYHDICGQIADLCPDGVPYKNPFYLYGIRKRHRIVRHKKSYEVLSSDRHSSDFDADFMDFAHKVGR